MIRWSSKHLKNPQGADYLMHIPFVPERLYPNGTSWQSTQSYPIDATQEQTPDQHQAFFLGGGGGS